MKLYNKMYYYLLRLKHCQQIWQHSDGIQAISWWLQAYPVIVFHSLALTSAAWACDGWQHSAPTLYNATLFWIYEVKEFRSHILTHTHARLHTHSDGAKHIYLQVIYMCVYIRIFIYNYFCTLPYRPKYAPMIVYVSLQGCLHRYVISDSYLTR